MVLAHFVAQELLLRLRGLGERRVDPLREFGDERTGRARAAEAAGNPGERRGAVDAAQFHDVPSTQQADEPEAGGGDREGHRGRPRGLLPVRNTEARREPLAERGKTREDRRALPPAPGDPAADDRAGIDEAQVDHVLADPATRPMRAHGQSMVRGEGEFRCRRGKPRLEPEGRSGADRKRPFRHDHLLGFEADVLCLRAEFDEVGAVSTSHVGDARRDGVGRHETRFTVGCAVSCHAVCAVARSARTLHKTTPRHRGVLVQKLPAAARAPAGAGLTPRRRSASTGARGPGGRLRAPSRARRRLP